MSSIKKTTNLYCLNSVQQKGLNLQLNKLDLHNRLMLILNKKIEKFPHNKISDKLGGDLNQNIIFNFSKNYANTDRRLINNKNLVSTRPSLLTEGDPKVLVVNGENAIKLLSNKITDLGPVQVKNPARLGIINNVVHIITSFFNGLGCLISRPKFIYKTNKLIIRIFYYQNNLNKDALFNNNKSNFIYDLFNGTNAVKAQNNAPNSKNFATILRDMLGQTKLNRKAQTMFKNNEVINSLELSSISKKVFILFIKDFMNLTSSKKGLSIEKALIQLQKGAPTIAAMPATHSLKRSKVGRFIKAGHTTTSWEKGNGLIGFKNYNKLLIKLINSTNADSLIRKRTRLSKIFNNKTLWAKLQNKINKNNNSLDAHIRPFKQQDELKKTIASYELIGKGNLMRPVNKAKLDKIVGWSSNNLDLSTEYKTIATALLFLFKNNDVNSLKNVGPFGLGAKLTNKINKDLTSLVTQFTDDLQNNVDFIIGNIRSLNSGKVFSRRPKIFYSGLNGKFNLSSTYLKGTQSYNVLNIIKLINRNLEPKFEDKLNLSVIKEILKTYSYRFNANKADNALTGIIGSLDNVNKFKLLGKFLSKIFKKNIELQIVKLYNVGLEETILAKVISENAKFNKSSVLIKKLLKKINVSKASLIQFNKQNNILNGDSHVYEPILHNKVAITALSNLNNQNQQLGIKLLDLINNNKKNIRQAQLYDQVKRVQILNTNPLALGKVVGLNIRIAGRLQKEASKPKQTIKTINIGSLSKERANSIGRSAFTYKNKKGTYRVTVQMAHSRTFSTSTKQI